MREDRQGQRPRSLSSGWQGTLQGDKSDWWFQMSRRTTQHVFPKVTAHGFQHLNQQEHFHHLWSPPLTSSSNWPPWGNHYECQHLRAVLPLLGLSIIGITQCVLFGSVIFHLTLSLRFIHMAVWFVHSSYCVVFCFVNVQFIYPVGHRWEFGLFIIFGYSEQHCLNIFVHGF